jgi:hypothetical protein
MPSQNQITDNLAVFCHSRLLGSLVDGSIPSTANSLQSVTLLSTFLITVCSHFHHVCTHFHLSEVLKMAAFKNLCCPRAAVACSPPPSSRQSQLIFPPPLSSLSSNDFLAIILDPFRSFCEDSLWESTPIHAQDMLTGDDPLAYPCLNDKLVGDNGRDGNSFRATGRYILRFYFPCLPFSSLL